MKSSEHKGDRQNLRRLLAKNDFKPTLPVQGQIASHLRQLIEQKRIPVHTKLPSMRVLAEMWGTNYHTVQIVLTNLAGEGLVALRPAQGCFIAEPRRALRRACFYYSHSADTVSRTEEFYAVLNLTLYNLLSRRGAQIIPFFDHRHEKKLHTAPSELREMISEGEVDAVFGTEIYPTDTDWLLNLEVPVTSTMLFRPERKIEIDFAQMVNHVIDLALKENRKTIGLIHLWTTAMKEEDSLFVLLREAAAPHGISVVKAQLTPGIWGAVHWEQAGEILCEKLLEAPVPPDLIFVFPDAFIRGVATVLTQNRIRVPEDILVVSHRNDEIRVYVPFPMVWLTVSVRDFALKMIEQIDRQIAGDGLAPATIPVKIERTAPVNVGKRSTVLYPKSRPGGG